MLAQKKKQMNREISQKLKFNSIFSILTILLGVALLIFMIKVEDEPGALPLLLIIIGTIWFIINRVRIKKRNR